MKIINEEIKNYIEKLYPPFKDDLYKLQKYGKENKFPIIRNDTARFIVTLLSLKKIKSILEIGTSIGFSASLMATFLEENGHVTTIERCNSIAKIAEENFTKLNLEEKITLLKGEALDIIKNIKDKYDLIFIDGAKSHYLKYFKECIKLLNCNGIIIADDVLQKGSIAKNISEISKRNKTIYKRMNNFLEIICNTEGIETTILPIGDGLSLSIKTKNNIVFEGDFKNDK